MPLLGPYARKPDSTIIVIELRRKVPIESKISKDEIAEIILYPALVA
jgi:hypothetical protein